MQKNFRFLKAITLVFALVLLVGCGLLFGQNVEASADTVVFYVSDAGDNTAGVDEATAFTSINEALKKAADMKLPQGTTVKLLVAGRVTVTTQTVDSTVPLDTQGNRLPVHITSVGGEKADIYLAYFDPAAASGTQYAIFNNDIYFKDIDVTIKIFEERVGFAETGARWCQKNVYYNGHRVTLDNCRVAPERGDTSAEDNDVPDIIMGLDYSTNNAVYTYDNKVVTLKNGAYTAAAVFMHQYRLPDFRLTVNLENASFGSLHVCPMTSTATTPDLKKFTVNIGKDVTITNLYITRQGHIDIEEGLTINYYDGCTIGNVCGTSASDDSGSGFNAAVTHNIYGGNITNFTASPARGVVKQPVVVNMYGGTIGNYYGGGVAAVNDIPSVTNNIYGGTITTGFYGGPQGKGHIGTVTNNITGGTFATCFLGGKSGNVDTLTNTVTGGTFGTIYGGAEAGYAGTITNTFSDLSLNYIYGGGKGSGANDGAGSITNNFTNVSVAKELYGAVYAGVVGDVTNNFTNVKVGGSFYGGGYNSGSSSDVTGTITNNMHGITVSNFYLGGVRSSKQTGKVINNIYDGTFKTNAYYGGGRTCTTNTIGSIENNIYGGTFAAGYYGGNYETGNVAGDIVNRIYGGNFTNVFYGGHRASTSDGSTNGNVNGNIINEFYGGVFTSTVTAGNRDTAGTVGGISTTLAGGSFRGATFNAVSGKEGQLLGKATLSIAPSADADYLTIKSAVISDSALTTTVSGGERPVLIGETTAIAIDSFVGKEKLTVSQTEKWVEDEVYFSFVEPVSEDQVIAVNSNSQVTGSGWFNGYALIGTAEPSATPAAPGLATMVSFQLDDTLGVRFWVSKSDVEAYIQSNGKWSYGVSFAGQQVASASFTSIPASAIKTDENGNEYVTFLAGLGIPASRFGEEITIVLGDLNTTTYTVFELLEIGAESAALSGDAKLATLLQSIHNYGVEAYNYFEGAAMKQEYSVPVNGTYETMPSFTKDARGYEFVSTSLSLDEKIAMNFYLKAAGEVNFTATVKASGAKLSADKVLVQKIADDMYVVTLKLDAKEMNEVYVLTASDAAGVVATSTNSVSYSCAQYIKAGVAAEVAETILAYLESVQAYFVA